MARGGKQVRRPEFEARRRRSAGSKHGEGQGGVGAAASGRARSAVRRLAAACLAAAFAAPAPASAQHWSFDARRIALGDARDVTSIASVIVPPRRTYRTIVLPLRLVQILDDLDVYRPGGENFDPIRAITNVASPLHYTFGDDGSSSLYVRILNDLLNFDLDRDVSGYLDYLDVDLEDLDLDLGSLGASAGAVGAPGAAAFGIGASPAAAPGAGARPAGASPAAALSLGSLLPGNRLSLLDESFDWDYLGEWLVSRSWGRTFTLYEGASGVEHALYTGVGPYLSFHSDARVNGALRSYVDVDDVVRAVAARRLSRDLVHLDVTFDVENRTYTQAAAAVVGGYRARLPLPGRPATGRDGIYVALHYNHLFGIRYEDLHADFGLALDSAGLSEDPAVVPLGTIARATSGRGRGFALDAGVAFVIDRWNFGFGATGLMNRIDWRNVTRGSLGLYEENLFSGFDEGALDGIREPAAAVGDRRVMTPVRYNSDVAYHAETWSALVNYQRGYLGNYVNAGVEYRFPWLDVRGSGRFKRDRWHPAGGVGFEFRPGWHLDVAAFGTSLNPERRRRLAMAVSLRIE